jgi:hypothetical protein
VEARPYSDHCEQLEGEERGVTRRGVDDAGEAAPRADRVGGGAMNFPLALAVGTFLLAVWCDARLSEHRPATLVRRIVHVAVSGVLLQLACVGVALVGPTDAGVARQLTAVFAVLLPALVYAFLTGLWLMRTLAEAGLARR